MKECAYTLDTTVAERRVFASVTLQAETGSVDGYELVYAAGADVPRAFAVAADAGIQYAWSHQSDLEPAAGLHVRVKTIDTSSTTTPNAVAFAACHATWEALGATGVMELDLTAEELLLPKDA